MEYKISPHFHESKLDPNNIDDLIDVFEDRTRYWLFEPIQNLLREPNGGIAALGLLLTYFEGIAIYLDGRDSKDNSKSFFKRGFLDMFKAHGISNEILGSVSDLLYANARCGFFHDGFGFRGRILIAPDANQDLIITLPKINGLIDKKGAIQSIIINPNRLFIAIEHHFSSYMSELRNTSNVKVRLNFQEACKVKWKLERPPVVIGFQINSNI